MELIEYSRCTTCKKARKWLDDNNINYVTREITVQTPTSEEIKSWIDVSGVSANKLFNTSGLKYRELKLKDKLACMSLDEKISLLSSDGMLIKRPLLVTDDTVLIGFKEKEWEHYFNHDR